MSKKPKGLEHTYQVRLYPPPEQGRLLMAHCQEYIRTVNVLASALDADVIPHDATFSTKDFVATLPSCVKNQACVMLAPFSSVRLNWTRCLCSRNRSVSGTIRTPAALARGDLRLSAVYHAG